MKLDPGFPTHWKTERLVDELGADGVLALLRLWGKCQINREWKGLNLTPKRLAMETKWKGDENHLFRVFTDPDAAWLDKDEDGTFSLHGFEDHQKQVIHLWSAGKKGGRPRKVSLDSSKENIEDSYSYPNCKPNGKPNENQMVSRRQKRPTLGQAISAASTIGISQPAATAWWNAREASDWMKGTAGGGTTPVGANWQADLANSKGWAEDTARKNPQACSPKQFID